MSDTERATRRCCNCGEVITGHPHGTPDTPYCHECVAGTAYNDLASEREAEWVEPEPRHNRLTRWNWMVGYPNRLSLGERVDIGAFTYLNAKHGIDIASGVQIGAHCAIYSSSSIDDKQGRVVIESDARIGTHSTVMPGVTIGTGALVAAHSYVTSDVPAGERVAGVPATAEIGGGCDG